MIKNSEIIGGLGSGPQGGGGKGKSGKSLNPLRKDKGFMKLVAKEKSQMRYAAKVAIKSAAKKNSIECEIQGIRQAAKSSKIN